MVIYGLLITGAVDGTDLGNSINPSYLKIGIAADLNLSSSIFKAKSSTIGIKNSIILVNPYTFTAVANTSVATCLILLLVSSNKLATSYTIDYKSKLTSDPSIAAISTFKHSSLTCQLLLLSDSKIWGKIKLGFAIFTSSTNTLKAAWRMAILLSPSLFMQVGINWDIFAYF